MIVLTTGIQAARSLVDTMPNLDSATVPVVIALLGSACVLAGIFGGMTGTINLPTLNNGLRWSAGIFGVALLMLGSAMWLFPQTRTQVGIDHETMSTSTASRLAGPTSAVPLHSAAGTVRITYPPRDGAAGAPLAVSQFDNLVVEGTADGFANSWYLWLFDLDPDEGRMYAVSDSPIPVVKGIWSTKDDGITNPIGTYKLKYIVAVRADAQCNTELKAHATAAKKNNADPFGLSALPNGCVEDDRVPVDVSPP